MTIPTASMGTPMADRRMDRLIIPEPGMPGVPTDNTNIEIIRENSMEPEISIPYIPARAREYIPSLIQVPSMLTVAPRGIDRL